MFMIVFMISNNTWMHEMINLTYCLTHDYEAMLKVLKRWTVATLRHTSLFDSVSYLDHFTK